MRLLRLVGYRLRSLLRRRNVDAELDRELDLHLEALVREGMADGLSEADARRAARRAFGSRALVTEQCHDTRRVGFVEDLIKDTRYALRTLGRAPAFALTAVLSLALGIGANTAIFSLVDTVMLRSLPVQRPDELVFITNVSSDGSGGGAPPYPCFERFRNETTAFADMAAFSSADQLRVEIDGQVEQVIGQVTSGSFFDTLGLKPAAGRLMTMDDERAGAAVAVLGYGYWQRRFGGASNAIGRTLTFNDRPYTIVGVSPAEFWSLSPGRQLDVTLPMTLDRAQLSASTWWFDVVARLRSGADVAEARGQADAVFQSFMQDRPSPAGPGPRPFDHIELKPAARGLDNLRARFSTPLYILTALAGLVLLVACVNLGNLLLVRGTSRAHEFAIRLATGASAGRLVRQLLTETLWLFLLGAAAGFVAANIMSAALVGFFAVGRNPVLLNVHFDWRVAGFAAASALVAGLATGLWSAVRALRSQPHEAMKEGHGRIAGTRHRLPVGRLLVASQIALSLVLLVTAVMFVKTISNLHGVDLGFSGTRVLTMSLYPVFPEQDPATARQAYWDAVLERVRRVPRVRAASLAVLTPLSGRDNGRRIEVAGFEARSPADRTARVNHVSDDYFRTFGIPLRAGRTFTRQDDLGSPRVAIINEMAARTFFGGRNPIGESLRVATATYQIVGIVGDHKHRNLREEAPRMVFVPLSQPLDPLSRITLSVSSDERAALAGTIAAEVRAIDAKTLVSEVLDVQQQIDATLVSETILSTLASGFALLAIGLAAIGLYGVLSYAVSQRRTEFAVRMALGAAPGRVASSLMREVLLQVAIGTAIGLPFALASARAAEGLLFDVAPGNVGSYVLSAVLLCGVACLSAWLPARRAWSINPSEALRGE